MNKQMVEIKQFKVVVSGYINLNVIDGSAFFISGVASMCAAQKNVEIVVVSAKPIVNTAVISEMLKFPNIEIVDPFEDVQLRSEFLLNDRDSMSRREYADIVAALSTRMNADSILLRDTESGCLLVTRHRELADKTAVYVTGVSRLERLPSAEIIEQITRIADSGAKILVQTPQMQQQIDSLGISIARHKIQVLPPHVPDGPERAVRRGLRQHRSPVLVYAGKFFPDWNVDRIFAAVKAVNLEKHREVSLLVAGDQFRDDPEDRFFVDNVKYLLRSTANLSWVGGVSRAQSRELIMQADVGISWRRQSLDNSSEFSTKVLEYGSLGKAVILNRTRLHEELLGTDYPLFANSMTEFKDLLRRLVDMETEIELAATRCFELSKEYWYTSVLPGLLDFLGNRKESMQFASSQICGPGMLPIEKIDRLARVNAVIDGGWLRIVEDSNSGTTYEQVIDVVRTDLRFWERSIKSLGDFQDRSGFGDIIQPHESQLEPDVETLLKENETLKRELRALKKRISLAKSVLRRVEHHPLGGKAVQRLRWLKNRFR